LPRHWWRHCGPNWLAEAILRDPDVESLSSFIGIDHSGSGPRKESEMDVGKFDEPIEKVWAMWHTLVWRLCNEGFLDASGALGLRRDRA
jgi:hypothetical protein